MKSIFLSSFLFITLIACANEKEPKSNEANNTKITEETIEKVNQDVIDGIPDSLTEKIGDLVINETKGEKPSLEMPQERKPVIDEVKAETIKKEKVEVVKDDVTMTDIKEVKSSPQIIEKTPEPAPQVKAEIHKTWDDLLRKNVSSSGKVNYGAFVKDKDELNKYIKELKGMHKDVSSWGKNKRLAYWINVYNAVTVKLITDNYPVKTIKTIKGGKPWDTKLIDLGGTSYTLNVIENKIIRPKYNEPRIHFAVNCAAKSCPKIMNKAWTEDNIQRYLTKQTKAFIANTTENNISADKVELSKIFDWYKVDFGGNDAKLIQFINKYSDVKVNEGATVSFKNYNWDLNN